MADYSNLPGIAPEDVKVSPEAQAQIDAYLASQKAEEEALGKEQEIELYESELMACWKLLRELQDKYGYKKASFENLLSLKSEADDKFEKIGLQVVVDWVLPGLNETPTPPTITIVGRIGEPEFNPEQARYEIGEGIADDYYKAKREVAKSNGKKLIIPGQ